MKTIVTNLALAALGALVVACLLYIALYLVVVGGLIGLAYAIIVGTQRFRRWCDDRAHQAFIAGVMADIARKRKAPPVQSTIIR
jgi:hypothetical protein